MVQSGALQFGVLRCGVLGFDILGFGMLQFGVLGSGLFGVSVVQIGISRFGVVRFAVLRLCGFQLGISWFAGIQFIGLWFAIFWYADFRIAIFRFALSIYTLFQFALLPWQTPYMDCSVAYCTDWIITAHRQHWRHNVVQSGSTLWCMSPTVFDITMWARLLCGFWNTGCHMQLFRSGGCRELLDWVGLEHGISTNHTWQVGFHGTGAVRKWSLSSRMRMFQVGIILPGSKMPPIQSLLCCRGLHLIPMEVGFWPLFGESFSNCSYWHSPGRQTIHGKWYRLWVYALVLVSLACVSFDGILQAFVWFSTAYISRAILSVIWNIFHGLLFSFPAGYEFWPCVSNIWMVLYWLLYCVPLCIVIRILSCDYAYLIGISYFICINHMLLICIGSCTNTSGHWGSSR